MDIQLERGVLYWAIYYLAIRVRNVIEDMWDDLDIKVDYQDYLKSEHWKVTRNASVQRASFRCQVCNSPDKLEVHHRTYERLWDELPEDLTVLCSECHDLFHKNGRLTK